MGRLAPGDLRDQGGVHLQLSVGYDAGLRLPEPGDRLPDLLHPLVLRAPGGGEAGEPADRGVRWSSDGQGEYTIETIDREKRGTTITLHLREEEQEILDYATLKGIVEKYSDHVSFPIKMPVQDEEEEGWETVNRASALWMRRSSDISDEEYTEFYKHITRDFNDPLEWTHAHIEGIPRAPRQRLVGLDGLEEAADIIFFIFIILYFRERIFELFNLFIDFISEFFGFLVYSFEFIRLLFLKHFVCFFYANF